ncbi:MAG: hypothetical protein IKE22_12380 [Atopobiaceae bacterium]|nr:hypothetical protein [Atopobiaceae bacterium]
MSESVGIGELLSLVFVVVPLLVLIASVEIMVIFVVLGKLVEYIADRWWE